jgi:hypothetical protein
MLTDSTIFLALDVKHRRYRHRITVIINYIMTTVAFLVVIASLVALLVVGTEDMGSGHTVIANRSGHVGFANKGINVQTDTNQDQGCEAAGGTSAITNTCTATSGRGSTETSTQTSVILEFTGCVGSVGYTCSTPTGPGCNNLGCQSVTCAGPITGTAICTTDNGVQLPLCTPIRFAELNCTLTETQTVPGTGITQSGGVSGG